MVPYANCTSMSGCVRVISCSKEAGHNLEGGGGGRTLRHWNGQVSA